jgi:hydrophobic/amphiphilic exporter-1 (mainly G- bacteria), HAE1 family
MRIAEISIKRPVTTFMLVIIVLILGAISFTRLNVDLLPDINLPIAVVSTEYRGAGPREVEGIVTKNLESVMATVSNVKSIRSISSEGNSLIILEFNQGTDMDFATLDMREKIDLIKRMLPEGIGTPLVLKLNPNMMPIMNFAVSAGNRDVSQLKQWMEDVLKPRLERLEGVASVNILGGTEKEIKIVIDPSKLSASGLSLTQVVNSLRMENINAPGGIIGDGKYDLVVRTAGEFRSIEDIRRVPVITQTGATFLLGDLAVVEEGVKTENIYSKINGEDSLAITIQKESTSNTSKVADKVNGEIENIRKSNKDIQIVTILDQSQFINRSISSVKNNAVIGGILAIVILILFLKDIRPTIVIALSIPISVIATFIMVYFAGITLNMISLGGLALGVGMLVDNSIVVLENIYRLKQEGKSRMEAAKQGSSQVSMAIIASTLTTVCVFLPIVFVEGFTAEIFKQMALTVTFSLAASLAVALTLVPLLASRFLRDERFGKTNRVMVKVNAVYEKLLNWSLKHRKLVVAVTLVLFTVSLLFVKVIGTEFFPAADEGQISMSIKMPRGTRYEETARTLEAVEEMLYDIPEVTTVYASVGNSQQGMGFRGSVRDSGNITVILKALKDRNRSVHEVGDEIRIKTRFIPGCKITVNTGGSFMGGSNNSGGPIEISISGDNLEVLGNIAEDIRGIIETVEGTREVSSNHEKGAPELRVVLNRERASQYGLNVAMISSAVQNNLQGVVATRYKIDGKEIDIRVQHQNQDNSNFRDVENMLIQSPIGINVPLKTVASLEFDDGYVRIERQDQIRTVTVSSAVSGRTVGKVVKDIQSKLSDYELPLGYSLSYGGESKQMTEAFSSLALALVLGILLVYMVMASQFESLIYPFIIMFTVPLAFTGGLMGLILSGTPLSVPAFLGMLILSGIVVNNGIVLVDYINQLRSEGMGRNASITKAGPTRIQPILMTTLTTVLGLFPLALGFGEGAELQMPLAITVIGGLSFSTVLTLIVVPVIYTLVDDLGAWVKKKIGSSDGREEVTA